MARFGYADPPYPNCAHLYREHPDYAGEVDYATLLKKLQTDFDSWILHTNSVSIPYIASLAPSECRWMAWVKGFAAFKKNVSVAYAWEPILVKAVRKPVVTKRVIMRDWFEHSITLKKGLTGVKPEKLCHWLFEVSGLQFDDEFVDMFPGTGAVGCAWESWRLNLLMA